MILKEQDSNRFKGLQDNPTLENFINHYFVKHYTSWGEFAYYISKNSKFILTESKITVGDYSLIPNTSNLNNPKIKKWWELPREDYGGDFQSLTEENLIKLITDIYST